MKTFQEFIEEGIKKRSKVILKDIKKSIQKQQKQNPEQPPVADYGHSAPNSPEREAAIRAMEMLKSEFLKNLKKQNPG